MGFDAVFEYRIPYGHPLAVHFPLVLLVLAAGAALAYAVLGRAAWRHATTVLLTLAAPAALWARQTGAALYEAVEGEPLDEALIEAHVAAANWAVGVSAVALVAALGGALWWHRRQQDHVTGTAGGARLREPLGLRLLLLVVALAAAALVAYTAHVGATMVWGVPAR